ncbi:MAG: NAD-dependent epimerase/dehydratase family protein [Pseudomonadota bacterium]
MKVFITGTAGFIGYHLAELLLDEGHAVHGYDGFTTFGDMTLKQRRHQRLLQKPGYSATEALLEEPGRLLADIEAFAPEIIVHLAAQAGVRYSLENPRAYLDANVTGTFNVLEAAKAIGVRHLLIASTSSAYGANTEMPFRETDRADHQMTIYAATKKAGESMSHAWAHLHDIPTTLFRFFTVYGPWGRTDMAPLKFTQAIHEGRTIDIYNHGEMYRDFTYVTDLVRGIRLLMDAVPERPSTPADIAEGDSLSPAAPWRVVNIGNSQKVRLLDFIDAIEDALGIEAKRNYMEMQPGDVPATWADCSLLNRLTGYVPETDYRTGVNALVEWYLDYLRLND